MSNELDKFKASFKSVGSSTITSKRNLKKLEISLSNCDSEFDEQTITTINISPMFSISNENNSSSIDDFDFGGRGATSVPGKKLINSNESNCRLPGILNPTSIEKKLKKYSNNQINCSSPFPTISSRKTFSQNSPKSVTNNWILDDQGASNDAWANKISNISNRPSGRCSYRPISFIDEILTEESIRSLGAMSNIELLSSHHLTLSNSRDINDF